MHTPAQLHRSRRHTLPAKRHRLRRRTIQRLLQQRLRRRHRHRIRRRTATAAASHPAPPPDASSRPPGRNNFPRPASSTTGWSPTTASCRSPAPFNPSQVLDSDDPSPHPWHPPPSPSPAPTSDPHYKSGHQHPPPTPSPAEPASTGSRILLIKTIHRRRRQRPHRALRRVRHRNDLRPETHLRRPRQLLIPAQPHLRRRHLVQRRPRTNHPQTPSRHPATHQTSSTPASPPHPTPATDNSTAPPHSSTSTPPTHRRRSTPPQWS